MEELIRHNLSLYSIFEREKTKKHGSYWTIKEDCPEKAKVLPLRDKRELASKLPNSLPVTFIPHQSSTVPKLPISNKFSSHYQDGHRRNLQPILPRPGLYSPLQTYALIPIQNLNQSQRISNSQSQPMLIQVPANPQVLSQNTKHDPGSFQSKKVCDKTSKKKVVNIAPKCSSPNIVRQAWINAQTYSDSENEKLGNTKHCNISNKGSDQASAKKKKQNNGLPKPKIYSKNSSPKRVKARRKQKLIPKERDLMNDSSDEDMKDFMSKIEQDLPTPLRKILDGSDTENEKVTTSTPLKNASHPAELPSPIKGITPLKGVSLLDSSFLDCFKDSDNEDRKSVFGSPNFITGTKRNSMGQLGSPSQFDNLFSGLTPIKGELDSSNNENLSRFLSEFPLVESMETEDDCLSNSLAGMNWSAIYQHIGSTPNSKK